MTKLFGTMWRNGTVVVATSNRAPSELYENGLNRHYFLPFVDTLQRQCKLHDMSSVVDHRMLMTRDDNAEIKKYVVIQTGEVTEGHDEAVTLAAATLNDMFHVLRMEENEGSSREGGRGDRGDRGGRGGRGDSTPGGVVTVPTAFGRTLTVPEEDCCGGIVRFHFDQLFRTDLGAADYKALAQRFHTIFVYDIPVMNHR